MASPYYHWIFRLVMDIENWLWLQSMMRHQLTRKQFTDFSAVWKEIINPKKHELTVFVSSRCVSVLVFNKIAHVAKLFLAKQISADSSERMAANLNGAPVKWLKAIVAKYLLTVQIHMFSANLCDTNIIRLIQFFKILEYTTFLSKLSESVSMIEERPLTSWCFPTQSVLNSQGVHEPYFHSKQ